MTSSRSPSGPSNGRESRPSAAEIESARRLLAYEGASSSSEEYAAAAGRVCEKLNAQLGPLLGAAGVQALFARSAKLAQTGEPRLTGAVSLESPATLTAFLRTLEPAAAVRTAEGLFGAFLSLIATFIGERLTQQALRRAWPSIEQPAPTENKK